MSSPKSLTLLASSVDNYPPKSILISTNRPMRLQDEEEAQPIAPSHTPSHASSHAPPHIQFGSQPLSILCPFCLQQTKTEIIAKPELVSVVLGLVLFSLLPNAIMIVVTVVTLQVTATRKHRCSLCERELGTDGKFLIFFTDDVYSFSVGETGILVSKKIFVTIGLFLTMFLVISVRASLSEDLVWTEVSWNDFRTRCPNDALNPACLTENEGKTVQNWRGFVMRVEDQRHSMRRFYEHAVKIYIKMDPSELEQQRPDIVLTGSTATIYDFADTLDHLRHGDEVIFNATFERLRGQTAVGEDRHLRIFNLNSTGVINPHISLYLKDSQQQQLHRRSEGHALRAEATAQGPQQKANTPTKADKEGKTERVEQNANNGVKPNRERDEGLGSAAQASTGRVADGDKEVIQN